MLLFFLAPSAKAANTSCYSDLKCTGCYGYTSACTSMCSGAVCAYIDTDPVYYTYFGCYVGFNSKYGVGTACTTSSGGSGTCDASGNCNAGATPVNGVCDTSVAYGCSVGTAYNQIQYPTYYAWYCSGANGGTSPYCQKAISNPINGVCAATHYNCSAGTVYGSGDGGTYWYWFCLGQNGGNNSPQCLEYKAVNGVCNATHYLCNAGTSTSNGDYGTYYGWYCNGSNGGSNAWCTQTKPVNGVCAATHYNCNAGTSTSNGDYGTYWGWYCNGSNGGSNAYCTQNKVINGVCNATHYNCNAGTSGSNGDYGTYYGWYCNGINGGSNAWCTQNKVINGVCAATHYNCSAGTSGSNGDYGTYYGWYCNGINGGTSVWCTETNTTPSTVSIAANPSGNQASGVNVTYTAYSDKTVSSTIYYIAIYETTGGANTLMYSCSSGTSCSYTTNGTNQTRTFVGKITYNGGLVLLQTAPISTTWAASTTPTTINLTANPTGNQASGNYVQYTATTDKTVGGTIYTLAIYEGANPVCTAATGTTCSISLTGTNQTRTFVGKVTYNSGSSTLLTSNSISTTWSAAPTSTPTSTPTRTPTPTITPTPTSTFPRCNQGYYTLPCTAEPYVCGNATQIFWYYLYNGSVNCDQWTEQTTCAITCTDAGYPGCTCTSGSCICPTSTPTRTPTPTLAATSTPTPVPCSVLTTPSSINLNVGGTDIVNASVTSGLGSATINQMRFGSYNTSLATVNPTADLSSPYSTVVTGIAAGNTAVWATADLSDGRTCESTGTTDTDIIVAAATPTPSPTDSPCTPGSTRYTCYYPAQYCSPVTAP